MEFKIIYPSYFRIEDPSNDNIDVNVIISDGRVFFITMFTLENIRNIMARDNISYFWATDMLIVDYLDRKNIQKTVKRIIENEEIENVLSYIGDIDKIYSHRKWKSYKDVEEN